LAAILAMACIDVLLGPSDLSWTSLLKTLLGSGPANPTLDIIVWQIRLPQTLMALMVGASLGLAGAEMQTVLNNPLASPFTLGVSAAAAVGASIAVVGGFTLMAFGENLAVPLSAFVCAAAATLLIQLLAWRYGA